MSAMQDGGRPAEIAHFLSGVGWNGVEIAPLAGDASPRKYHRLRGGPEGRGAVLMDVAPAVGEPVGPFLAIAALLAARGLAPPEVLASDPDRGFVLLEDLGDALFARIAAAEPATEATLYAAAVDTLTALHAEPPPAGMERYDAVRMGPLAALAARWYLPGTEGRTDPEAAARLEAEVRRAVETHAPETDVVVLRDFHAENLIWLPERAGLHRVGLLDFQDAMAGHPGYDLVSLLEDARRDVAPALARAMTERYVRETDRDPERFGAACAALAAQRNLRILGVFARLCLRDSKPQYVDLIPRVWGHLMRDLEHPALAALGLVVTSALPEPTPARLARLREAVGTWQTR